MKREQLIEVRKRRFPHMSIRCVAETIGISEATLYRLEGGSTSPRGETLSLLAEAYGVEMRDLGFDDQPAQTQPALVSTPSRIPMTDTIKTLIDQDLTSRLMRIVIDEKRVDAVQGKIDQAVRDYEKLIRQDLDLVISRRNALRSIVLLPMSICVGSMVMKYVNDVLTQCAAGIAACCHFSAGKELAMTADALSVYIAALQTVTQQSERQKQTAAALLVQCLLLKAELARHVENCDHSIAYLKQAIFYGEMSGEPMLESLAWRVLAATYYHIGPQAWRESGNATKTALKLMKCAPKGSFPLSIQSFINAGASVYFAINGQQALAKDALRDANETWSRGGQDEHLWWGNSLSNLTSNNVLSYHYLGERANAANEVQKLLVTSAHALSETPQYRFDAIRVETFRDDQPRRLDFCIEQWKLGVAEARDLQSTLRIAEAWSALNLMQAAWPHEQSVKGLQQLLQPE